jgi:CheY-like chemotaxis protein
VNLYLAVSDTGTGIPDHLQRNVFESFFQAQSGYTRDYQGSGLGLAIIRKIVRRMGGSVCIDSTEGAGTTVYVHMPLRRQGEARPASAETVERLDMLPPRLKILVVDDEPVGRMALQVILERMGHEVEFAEDGAEALECIRAKPFDCVFMDIQMPRMNGIAATRTLRNDPAFRDSAHVYVIAMTAYAMTGDRELFLADGMNDYVAKPASIAAIEESLARFLARR